jgi:ornithine decarboxylase
MTVLAPPTRPQLPSHWPAALHPAALERIDAPTPFLAHDLRTVAERAFRFRADLPGVTPFYATKCNSTPEVLCLLAALGASFEIASLGELRMLTDLEIDPAGLLYSNPIKPVSHVVAAHRAGVWRFSFDSARELHKLAAHAPGAAVYLRLSVAGGDSTFPLIRKFGIDPGRGRELMLLARGLGLRPYGLTFHVGSQCASPGAWEQALAVTGRLMAELRADGIELEMLDIGGGFPARYIDEVPSLAQIGQALFPALDALLPYRPPLIAAEPGRYLVAEAGVMVSTVLGREWRGDEQWLYLDVGAFNGLMEPLQAVGRWRFPFWTGRPDHGYVPHVPFTIAGPSCDSVDTIFYGVPLPETIEVDDRVYIGTAGAYTLSYASGFNGFLPPEPVFVDSTGTLPVHRNGSR